MQTKQWDFRLDERKKWGDGPWLDEPDKLQWPDEKTGLPCLIVRNRLGALCGYVGVTEGHPLFGKHYSNCAREVDPCESGYCSHSPEAQLIVHGGITYSDQCEPEPYKEIGICHFPDEGEPDDVYWFGFDTAHCMDLVPGMTDKFLWHKDQTYKDVNYVKATCAELADQLAAMAQTPVERVIDK